MAAPHVPNRALRIHYFAERIQYAPDRWVQVQLALGLEGYIGPRWFARREALKAIHMTEWVMECIRGGARVIYLDLE